MSLALKRIASPLYVMLIAALVLTMVVGAPQPTLAATSGQISTRNIILGALGATAIVLYNNWQHKRAYANSVVGYTQDGGTVYGDGRIVYPDGTVIYTSNNGNSVCTFDGYGQQCQPGSVNGYYPANPNGYNGYNGYNANNGYNGYNRYNGYGQNNSGDDQSERANQGYANGRYANGRYAPNRNGYYYSNANGRGRHHKQHNNNNQGENQNNGD